MVRVDPRGSALSRAASVLAAAALLHGCYLSHGRPGPAPPRDGGFDARPAPRDAGRDAPEPIDAPTPPRDADPPPPRDAGPPRPLPCEAAEGVDFLLVLDDSGSIRPRDPQLQYRLRRLVHDMVRPPDLDGDGWEDWPRVDDLHVGVVSTSVRGTEFCSHVADGRLMSLGSTEIEHCAAEYPPFLTYREGVDDPDTLARDATCIAFGPREGCTVEQPLEAMAKALLPRSAPFTYIAGGPHGDGFNAGFLRDDSVLVVLFVGDEDDCSLVDPGIFERPDAGHPDAAPLPIPGCLLARPDQLQPIDRYEAVLRWLRPAHPERVVIGMIIGIEGVYTGPLDEDPPGCFGRIAYPRRMLELARAFPTHCVLGSLCGLSEGEIVRAIASRVAGAACDD